MARSTEIFVQYQSAFPGFMQEDPAGSDSQSKSFKTLSYFQRVPPQTYNCGGKNWAQPFLEPQALDESNEAESAQCGTLEPQYSTAQHTQQQQKSSQIMLTQDELTEFLSTGQLPTPPGDSDIVGEIVVKEAGTNPVNPNPTNPNYPNPIVTFDPEPAGHSHIQEQYYAAFKTSPIKEKSFDYGNNYPSHYQKPVYQAGVGGHSAGFGRHTAGFSPGQEYQQFGQVLDSSSHVICAHPQARVLPSQRFEVVYPDYTTPSVPAYKRQFVQKREYVSEQPRQFAQVQQTYDNRVQTLANRLYYTNTQKAQVVKALPSQVPVKLARYSGHGVTYAQQHTTNDYSVKYASTTAAQVTPVSTVESEPIPEEPIHKPPVLPSAPPPAPAPAPVPVPAPAPLWWERELETVWKFVFEYLTQREAVKCMLVCTDWAKWLGSVRSIWEELDLGGNTRIDEHVMTSLGKKDPLSINLSWSGISERELAAFVVECRRVRSVSLAGCHWSCVPAMLNAPQSLQQLDLRWVTACTDANVKRVFVGCSVLLGVEELFMSGCDIGDATVRFIANQMHNLKALDLSYCARLTDVCVSVLSASGCPARRLLRQLTLTGCHNLTPNIFNSLHKMQALRTIDLRAIPHITPTDCHNYETHMKHKGIDLVVLR